MKFPLPDGVVDAVMKTAEEAVGDATTPEAAAALQDLRWRLQGKDPEKMLAQQRIAAAAKRIRPIIADLNVELTRFAIALAEYHNKYGDGTDG